MEAFAGRLGLQFAQGFEGAEVGAPGGIDAALEANEELVLHRVAFGKAPFVAGPGFVVLGNGLLTGRSSSLNSAISRGMPQRRPYSAQQ